MISTIAVSLLAMGFWTFGPVAGYFVLSAVARAYLPLNVTFANWQELNRIAGYAGIVMFVIGPRWICQRARSSRATEDPKRNSGCDRQSPGGNGPPVC